MHNTYTILRVKGGWGIYLDKSGKRPAWQKRPIGIFPTHEAASTAVSELRRAEGERGSRGD